MLYTFIILAVVIVIVAVIAEIYLRRQQPDRTSPQLALAEEKITGFFSKTVEDIKGMGNKIRDRKSSDLSGQFRSWAADGLETDEDLKVWLAALSDKGIEALTEQLATFCSELNLELSWLVRQQLNHKPDLKRAGEEIVIFYCRACWKAVQIQDDIQIFTTLQDIQNNPSDKKYRALSQKLYAELAKRELVSEAPDLFTAPEKVRWGHVAQAIHQVAQTDQNTFDTVFKEVAGLDGSV